MNILLTSYWSYPATGAIDVYMRTLSSDLERRGHKVGILARNGWEQLRLLPEGGSCDLRVVGAPIVRGLWSHFGTRYASPPDWVMQREGEQYTYELGALRLCAALDVDLVHAQDVLSARAARRVFAQHIPVVLTTHGLLAYEWLVEKKVPGDVSMEWRYTFFRERAGILASSVTIVPGQWMARQYRDVFGIASDHLKVLAHGFDPESYRKRARLQPRELPSLAGRKIITCVARLVPLKGHDHLVDALVTVVKQVPTAICLLVGDGPNEFSLRRKVIAKGIDRAVFFLGPRDDVPAILARTHVFVLPSLQEVTPFSISEAQLLGVPVVASAVGSVPDIVEDGHTGLLVPAGDPTALAQALVRVLKDDDLAQALGRNGSKAIESGRTWAQHCTELLALYDEVLSATARRGQSAGQTPI